MNLKRFKTGLLGLLSTCLLGNSLFAASFIDEHNDEILSGWSVIGNCQWQETGGVATTLTGSNNQGFLINSNTCSPNGTLEMTINADQWNGNKGGIVFRWTSELAISDNRYNLIARHWEPENGRFNNCIPTAGR